MLTRTGMTFSAQGTLRNSVISRVFRFPITRSADTIRGLGFRKDVQVCALAAEQCKLFLLSKMCSDRIPPEV